MIWRKSDNRASILRLTPKSFKSIFWEPVARSKSNIQVKKLNKSYWGNPIGSKMLIPSPKVIQEYINNSEFGDKLDVRTCLLYTSDAADDP